MEIKMDPLEKLLMTFEYLFGIDLSSIIPLNKIAFKFSKKTGKIKSVFLDGTQIFNFRPDGGLVLTINGAKILYENPLFKINCIVVNNVARDFIAKGNSVFTKHVITCSDKIKPKSEVVILDVNGEVIAVGRALISAKMIKQFQSGVAAKVRQGIKNNNTVE